MPPLAGRLMHSLRRTADSGEDFYLTHLTAARSADPSSSGAGLFLLQMLLAWRALRQRPQQLRRTASIQWLTHLAQAAEWFPLLTVCSAPSLAFCRRSARWGRSSTTPQQIITLYSPAITATCSGLFMALINILPTWLVLVGRDLIRTLGGDGRGTDRHGRKGIEIVSAVQQLGLQSQLSTRYKACSGGTWRLNGDGRCGCWD